MRKDIKVTVVGSGCDSFMTQLNVPDAQSRFIACHNDNPTLSLNISSGGDYYAFRAYVSAPTKIAGDHVRSVLMTFGMEASIDSIKNALNGWVVENRDIFFSVVLVGLDSVENNRKEDEIKRYIQANDMHSKVRFLGFLEEGDSDSTLNLLGQVKGNVGQEQSVEVQKEDVGDDVSEAAMDRLRQVMGGDAPEDGGSVVSIDLDSEEEVEPEEGGEQTETPTAQLLPKQGMPCSKKQQKQIVIDVGGLINQLSDIKETVQDRGLGPDEKTRMYQATQKVLGKYQYKDILTVVYGLSKEKNDEGGQVFTQDKIDLCRQFIYHNRYNQRQAARKKQYAVIIVKSLIVGAGVFSFIPFYFLRKSMKKQDLVARRHIPNYQAYTSKRNLGKSDGKVFIGKAGFFNQQNEFRKVEVIPQEATLHTSLVGKTYLMLPRQAKRVDLSMKKSLKHPKKWSSIDKKIDKSQRKSKQEAQKLQKRASKKFGLGL